MTTEGKVFRTDSDVPMKPVVDYALGRPDVDPFELACSSHVGMKFIENVQAPDPNSAGEKALSILEQRPMEPSGCRIKKTTAQ
jgi:hypothetical protein